MKKRNWLKTTIAMITLVATVLETGFTSVSTLAAEITTEDGIVVNNDAVTDAESDGYSDDIDIDVSTDYSDDEDLDAASVTDAEEDADPVEEESFEEADELKAGSLDVSDSGITGSGYDEISIYVDTESLKKKDTFRIDFSGPASASYNPIINDDLDKTAGGRYDFEQLEGEEFTVRASSSDDVILSYKYNEDGYPTIVVESKETDKALSTRTLTAPDGSEAEAVSGEGYESVTVKFNTDDLSDKAKFKFFVESDADATVDGQAAADGIDGLNKKTDSVTIENLEGESFVAYVVTDDEEIKIKSIADVDSVEDGIAVITIDNEDTKRVYEYEDNDVSVTATLEKADAIPDDAEFVVTKVTPETEGYNYDAYMQALNDNSDAILGRDDAEISGENALLYDIAFYTTDADGNRIELQPEEGAVKISIRFKKDQLGDLEANKDEDIVVVHLPLDESVKDKTETTAEATNIKASDINVEVVENETSVSEGNTEFEMSDFSIVSILYKNYVDHMDPGPSEDFRSVLGRSVGYGIVGKSVTLGGDLESTMAVGDLYGNKDIKGPKNDSGNAGVTYIGNYHGSAMIYDNNGNKSNLLIYTTPDSYKRMGTNMYNNGNGREKVTVDTSTYSEPDIKKIVSDLVSEAQSKSKSMARTAGYKFEEDAVDPDAKGYWFKDIRKQENSRDVIDLTSATGKGTGAGTYYINFNEGEYASANMLQILLDEGQNIILTIPDETVGFKQYEIKIGNDQMVTTNGQSSEDKICQTVVFNCPNATTAYTAAPVSGIFLVPFCTDFYTGNKDGSIDYSKGQGGSVGAGWVIADTISCIGGNEWHFVWHDLPSSEGTSVQFFARKYIKGIAGDEREPLDDEKFEFELLQWNYTEHQYKAIQPPVSNEGSLVTFAPIYYSYDDIVKEGGSALFSYKIVERDSTGFTRDTSLPNGYNILIGVTADTNTRKLNITRKDVYDGAPNGQPTYGNNSFEKDNTCLVFKNIPKGDEATYEFKVKKNLFIGDKKAQLKDEVKYPGKWPYEFEFQLEYWPQDPYNHVSQNPTQPVMPNNGNKNSKVTVYIDSSNNVKSFGSVTFDAEKTWNEGIWITKGSRDWNNLEPMMNNEEKDHGQVRYIAYKYRITEKIKSYDGVTYGYDENDKPDPKDKTVYTHYIKLFCNVVYTPEGGYRFITKKLSNKKEIKFQPKHSDPNKVPYPGNQPCEEWGEEPVEFFNRYRLLPCTETFYGLKTINNNETERKPEEGEFTFKLTSTDDENLASRLATGASLEATNGADGKFSFGPLTYTLDDVGKTYTYTISEVEGSEQNMHYAEPKTITITIGSKSETIRDEKTGKTKNVLRAYIVNKDEVGGLSPDSALVFDNTFTADTDVVFKATKKFGAGSNITDKKFTFKLDSVVNGVRTNIGTKDAVKEGAEYTTDGDEATFDTIEYKLTDAGKTFNYVIYEDVPTAAKTNSDHKVDGVTYDVTEHNVSVKLDLVTVKNNETGKSEKQLKKTITLDGVVQTKEPVVINPVFTNSYSTVNYKDDIDGEKTLIGKKLEKDEFHFVLGFKSFVDKSGQTFTEAKDDFVKLPAQTTVSNDENGSFKFDKIEFSKPGTYTFTVVELEAQNNTAQSTEGGEENTSLAKKYYPDGTTYTVTFRVKDNGNGQLVADENNRVITKDNQTSPEEKIEFKNRYSDITSIPLFGIKNFDTIPSRPIRDGEFKFTITGNDGKNFKKEGETKEVSNSGTTVSFGTLHYDTTMLNKDGNGKYIATDFTYHVAEVIPWDDLEKVGNEYVKKTVGSQEYYVGKNGIWYGIHAGDGYDVTVHVDINDAGKLIPTLEDSFAHASSTNASENEIQFYNRYYAKGEFDASIFKSMSGRQFEDGDVFTFGLFAPGDTENPIRTIVITGSQLKGQSSTDELTFAPKVEIDSLNLPTANPSDYIIKEISCVTAQGKEITSCTPDQYIVRMTYTDNGEGKLDCATTMYKNSVAEANIVEKAAFVNQYNAEGEVDFEIEKKFNKTLEKDTFKFYFIDKQKEKDNRIERFNGHGINNVEIADTNKVIFDKITYTREKDLKQADGTYVTHKEYFYEMGENDYTDGNGISYNTENAYYEIKVTIEDPGTGKLVVKKETVKKNKDTKEKHEKALSEGQTPYINNEYHTTGREEIFATKMLEGKKLGDAPAGLFRFRLTPEFAEEGAPYEVAVDNTTGKALFNMIPQFTEQDLDPDPAKSHSHKQSDGSFVKKYTLEEIIPTDAQKVVTDEAGQYYVYTKDGYIYDNTKYNVEITLRDNKQGKIETSWKVFRVNEGRPEDPNFFKNIWEKIKQGLENVGWDKYNWLKVEDHRAVFVNKYESVAAIQLSVIKNFVGEGKTIGDGDFSFTIDGDDITGYQRAITIAKDENGNPVEPRSYEPVVFDKIVYTEAGEHEYTIAEVIPSGANESNNYTLNGVKYDPVQHKVYVKVSENATANGKLNISVKIDNDTEWKQCPIDENAGATDDNGNAIDLYVPTPVSFTNSYEVLPVSLAVGGSKVLTGRDMDGELSFTFKIEEKTDDTFATAVSNGFTDEKTVTRKEDGTFPPFMFEPMEYTLDMMKDANGSYLTTKYFYYLVNEVEPENKLADVVYDKKEYKVVVKVTNNEDGILTATVTQNDLPVATVISEETKSAPKNLNFAEFDNTHVAPGEIPFSVIKTVKNNSANNTVFVFHLDGTDIATPLEAKAVNNGPKGDFPVITYNYDKIKAAGGEKDYHYVITEDQPKGEGVVTDPVTGISKLNGIKYTLDKYEIDVKVKTPANKNDDLIITHSTTKYKYVNGQYVKDDTFVDDGTVLTFPFENEYEAEGIAEIPGNKKVTGKDPQDGDFWFDLLEEDGVTPVTDHVRVNPVTTSGGNGDFAFYLDYTLADKDQTFKYKVKEHVDDELRAKFPELHFDETVYDVVIVPKDNGDGTMDATPVIKEGNTQAGKCTFDNNEVKPDSLQFKAKKSLDGRLLQDGWFKFSLTGDAPAAQKALGQNTISQTEISNHGEEVTFDAIQYSYADAGKTYTYKIRETEGTDEGIVYDDTIYTATVEIKATGDNKTKKIEVVPVVKPDKGPKKGTNVAVVEFDEANNAYTVTGPEFNNTHTSEIFVQFEGDKKLLGFKETPTEKFTFGLFDKNDLTEPLWIDADGNVVAKGTAGATEQVRDVDPVKGELHFTFDKIRYSQEDFRNGADYVDTVTKNYVVKEIIPSTRTQYVDYDEHTYNITVKLTYDEPQKAGAQIKAEISTQLMPEASNGPSATDKDAQKTVHLNDLVFTNRYLYNSVSFPGIKSVEGRELKDAAYTFTLTDVSTGSFAKAATQTKQNSGSRIEFEPIEYSKDDVGLHIYKIEETVTSGGTVLSNLTRMYRGEVEVTVEGDDLKVDKHLYLADDNFNKISELDPNASFEFKNEYNYPAEVKIPVRKVMFGKYLKKGEFTYNLYDKDDLSTPLQTITNETNSEGTTIKPTKQTDKALVGEENVGKYASVSDIFWFAPIKYNSIPDLNNKDTAKKYYVVKEDATKDHKDYIDYATTVYVVEVTLTATDNGLTAQVTGISSDDDKSQAQTGGIAAWLAGLFGGKDTIDKIGDEDACVFKNWYKSEATIDPPVLTKTVMGREFERGDFVFDITGPGLPSMGEDKYEREVFNGYYTSKDGTRSEFYPNKVDDSGKPVEIPVEEIFVGDIKYQFNADYNDLEAGKAVSAAEAQMLGSDEYVKYVYTAVEKKGTEVAMDYTPAEFTLTVYVKDNGDGTMTVKNYKGDIHDEEKNIKTLKWIQKPGTGNKLEKTRAIDENGVEQYYDFVNIYPQEGHIDLVGTKKYNAPDFKENMFKFTLTETDENGNALTYTDKDGADLKGKTKSVTVGNMLPTINGKKVAGEPTRVEFSHKDVPFLNYKAGAYIVDGKYEEYKLDDVQGYHYYKIVETEKTIQGVKYDASEYSIIVDVQPKKDSNDNPYLEAAIVSVEKIVGGSGRPEKVTTYVRSQADLGYKYHFDRFMNSFAFDNTFEAYGDFSIPGKKYVVDEAGNALVSPDAYLNQYEFALYSYTNPERTEGKKLEAVDRCDDKGNFELKVTKENKTYAYELSDLINQVGSYQKSKTFYYRIIEVKPSVGKWTQNNTVFESEGVIYDNSEFDIDVTISFDGTKNLVVTRDIKKNGKDAASEITFVNPTKEYKTIEGNKFWNDAYRDPSQRPDVIVHLYSSDVDNGKTIINTYTIKAPDTTYRFDTDKNGDKLPCYDDQGKEITYSVEEVDIPGYLCEQDGYDFYNTEGQIFIRKIDEETGRPLAGAVLALLDGSTEIERWTTGPSAHVVDMSKLKVSTTYTVREISAPDGYDLAPDQTFKHPDKGETITVTMADKKIVGSVRLTKRDAATRETLAGAEFALYTEAGARIYATGTAGSYRVTDVTSNGVFVTDASGSLTISDLPYGTYYFEETKAPEGYSLSTERLGFTVLKSGELVEVTYLDPKAAAAVRLRKVGSNGTAALAGAVFELYSSTPRTLGQAASSTIFSDAYYRYGTYRTNSAGEIYVDDLPWGDYYFVETEAPDGYRTSVDVNGDELVYTFTVDASTTGKVIDLGGIVNNPEEGVLGARVKRGGVVNGVLGVRAKPVSGVLGERIGPVTGDASNIILWLLLLTACVATIVATIVTGKKKKTAK